MFRASMVEAPIDEHRDSLLGEDNVRAHRPTGGAGETKVLAGSKTAGVELGSQAALGVVSARRLASIVRCAPKLLGRGAGRLTPQTVSR